MFKDEVKTYLDTIPDFLEKKHHEYGIDNLLDGGVPDIITRCKDKLARMKNIEANKFLAKSTGNIEKVSECLKEEDEQIIDIIGYMVNAHLINIDKYNQE